MPSLPTTKSGRLPCCAPFCGRTTSQAKHPGMTEYLCPKHWPTVPKRFRQLLSRLKRRAREADASLLANPNPTTLLASSNAWRRQWRAWERCRAEAFKRIGDVS